MNELLGWYGLPSMDTTDAGSLPGMMSLAYSSSPQNGVVSPDDASATFRPKAEVQHNKSRDSNVANDKCVRSGDIAAENKCVERGERVKEEDTDNDGPSSSFLADSKTASNVSGMAKTVDNDSNNNSNSNDNNNNNDNENSGDEDSDDNIIAESSCSKKRILGTSNGYYHDDDGDEMVIIGPVNPEREKHRRHNINREDKRKDEGKTKGGGGGDEEDDDYDDENDGGFVHRHRDSVSRSSEASLGDFASLATLDTAVPESERSVVIVCSWCQRDGNKLFTLETATGVKSFCGERCFTQCRRASFKKNKVCDWCRHVRHTVNFVDFQDGDTQLQFCSEKCLNQYKMNIFCKEAREHLKHFQDVDGTVEKTMNLESKKGGRGQTDILITPDLWMAGNDPSNHAASCDVVKRESEDEINEEGGRGQRHNKSGVLRYGRKEVDISNINDEVDKDDDDDELNVEELGNYKERIQIHRAENLEEQEDILMGSNNDENPNSKRDLGKHTFHGHSSRTKSDSFHVSDKERDRERFLRLLVEGDRRVQIAKNSSSSSRKSKRSNIEPGQLAETTANSLNTNSLADETCSSTSKSSDRLLSPWDTSRLLQIPHSLAASVAAAAAAASSPGAGLNESLNLMGYPSSSLMYSNLFRLPQMNPPAASSLNNASIGESQAAATQRRSRHELRRELLRDRDLSRETVPRDRELPREAEKENKLGLDRENADNHAMPLSPSTSHSSAGTPAPVPTQLCGANILHGQGSLPGLARYFPHPLLMANGSQASTPSSLFPDPSQAAAILQLHLALQQTSGQNPPLHDIPFLQMPHTAPPPPPPPRPPPPPPPLPSSQNKSINSPLTSPDIGMLHQNHPSVGSSSQHHHHPSSSHQHHHQHHHHQQQLPLRPPQPAPSFTNESSDPPSLSSLFHPPPGVPPVTVLVPYPVAIPIPIPLPIPFPIPISPEKLDAFFKSKNPDLNKPSTSAGSRTHWNSEATESERSSRSRNGRSQSTNQSHPLVKISPASSPSPFNRSTPNLDLPECSSTSFTVTHDIPHPPLSISRESTDSIMTLRREITRPYKTSPTSSSPSLKRSFSPSSSYTFDLSKKPRRSFSSSSNDEEAMDLSKLSSRSASPKPITDTSEKENNSSGRLISPTVSPENLVVPKIHIVSDKSAPPLCTPPITSHLQSPLDQSSYSRRRSRILDAPCVPKGMRRPSPERRYVRNVPKDMVEAAKRRGLRARVRTK